MKILIVEDDLTLSENLKQVLLKDGFAVDIANSVESGSIEAYVNNYDCIVLDINLPDGNGFDFLSTLRSKEDQTPVIIATARGEVDDRINGLNLGADDYVPKPVNTNELIARIRATIRRNSNTSLPIITIGDLTIAPAQHKAQLKDKILNLTAKEFAVLEYLALHSNQVVTRTMLMEQIWGNDYDTFSNVIDVYIRNLRRKIEGHTNSNLIKTIRGKGYILGNELE
jgi:DNA-binding response OmpR family regulator